MQDETNQTNRITLDDLDRAPSAATPSATDVVVSVGDYVAALARVTDENSMVKQELADTKKKVKTSEILDQLIEPYARKAYVFMCAYSGFVGLFLLMYSFNCFKNKVDTTVLEFLVGSTAVTVIGLVGMVLTGIFIGARK